MSGAGGDWVSEAAALPVAFAQVREDPLLDIRVLGETRRHARILMVASGGCTAAALAAQPDVDALHLVDPNPAQMALSRIKLHLLLTADLGERLELLGHAPLEFDTRAVRLGALLDFLQMPPDALGPISIIAARGPDHAGRYERLFEALRSRLAPLRQAIESLLRLTDPREQEKRVHSDTPLGQALDGAFLDVMDQTKLVALFGESATRNPREPFSLHFVRQLRELLRTQAAAGNPFLYQMLLGRFEPGKEHHWLRLPRADRLPVVQYYVSPMVPVLKRSHSEFDMVHLSNILDWLSAAEAQETLELAWSALRPGGQVIVRQLNSTLDITRSCPRFVWQADRSAALLHQDRSFFYRAIFVGKRA